MSNVGDKLTVPFNSHNTPVGQVAGWFTVSKVDGVGNVQEVTLGSPGIYAYDTFLPKNPIHPTGGSATILLKVKWAFNTMEAPNFKRFYESKPITTDGVTAVGAAVHNFPNNVTWMGQLNIDSPDASIGGNNVDQMQCEVEHFNALASMVNAIPQNQTKYNHLIDNQLDKLQLSWNSAASKWSGFPDYSPAGVPSSVMWGSVGNACWPKNAYYCWNDDGSASLHALAAYFQSLGLTVYTSSDLPDGFGQPIKNKYASVTNNTVVYFDGADGDYLSGFDTTFQSAVAQYRWISIADAKTYLDSISVPMVIYGVYAPVSFSIIQATLNFQWHKVQMDSFPYVVISGTQPQDDPEPIVNITGAFGEPVPLAVCIWAGFVSDAAGGWLASAGATDPSNNNYGIVLGTYKANKELELAESFQTTGLQNWVNSGGNMWGATNYLWWWQWWLDWGQAPGGDGFGYALGGAGILSSILVRCYGVSNKVVIQQPRNYASYDESWWRANVDLIAGKYGPVTETFYDDQQGTKPDSTTFPGAGGGGLQTRSVIPIVAHNDQDNQPPATQIVAGNAGDIVIGASFQNAQVIVLDIDG